MRESGNNYAALVRNKHELVEIRNGLAKSETFWESNELVEENLGTGIDNPAYEEGEKETVEASMTLNNVSGVIDRFRIHLLTYF